ncbi:hypothetical protein [Rosenbergiella epipactidis]|uniref:hypothetical protein n=1 Tax=Rosenbergiella epipactidis TaxID=1544694 RepID=UPI001F4D8035|nr:hypothetical protein [Rosenbergiella epipactidis]
MSKEKKQIPFEFCKIGRAAKFLNIEVSDLLSLAVCGKITLCVRFDGLRSLLWGKGDAIELSNWYLSLESNYCALAFAHNISRYTSFSIDRVSFNESEDDPTFHPWFYQSSSDNTSGTSTSHRGRAYGLWVPQLPVIDAILNYGKSDLLWGSLDLYRTEESTPELCLIPIPLNYEDLNDNYDDNEEPEEIYPEVQITEDDLWITSEQVRELLEHDGDYTDLPNHAKKGLSIRPNFMAEIKKINHIAEHHATNREKLYKAAIFLLSKYPDECRGERKEVSPEKWRDCIVKHKKEIPPLAITNEEVMLKHLRSASNGKL